MDARTTLGKLIARERDEQFRVGHYNEAGEIIWPLLSQETQSKLVLR